MKRFMFVLALLGPAVGAPVQAQTPQVYFDTLRECNIALESGAAKAYTPGNLSKKGRYHERGDTIVITLSADECFFGDVLGKSGRGERKFVVLAKGTKMWAVNHHNGTATIFAMHLCDNNVHGERPRPTSQPFKAKPIEAPTEAPVLRPPTQTAAGILGGVGIIGNGNSVVMNPPAARPDSTEFYRQRALEAESRERALAALNTERANARGQGSNRWAWAAGGFIVGTLGTAVVMNQLEVAEERRHNRSHRPPQPPRVDTLYIERCHDGSIRPQGGNCPPRTTTDSVRVGDGCVATSFPNTCSGMGALAATTPTVSVFESSIFGSSVRPVRVNGRISMVAKVNVAPIIRWVLKK